jgi:hypothetical protein
MADGRVRDTRPVDDLMARQPLLRQMIEAGGPGTGVEALASG